MYLKVLALIKRPKNADTKVKSQKSVNIKVKSQKVNS